MLASQIEHNIGAWPAAADQEIAVRWRHKRLDEVIDGASDKPGLAIVADSGTARPSHRDIARLGQFEEALERRAPADIETALREGYEWPRAGGAGRQVRRLERGRGDSRRHGRTRSEYLAVDVVGGHAPG